ncbi:DUF397 domain-containing protein [Streptomyces sp. NRRL S-87]|uniref:DUF397 domain-containing protein n=1 Tax=Streptomyces sp. NRRL S-87 TaxID=1463920 RepID=UPI002D21A0FC|nr:DUF397 domain-containing protein [Streptomyces sp. NRRL S-87]
MRIRAHWRKSSYSSAGGGDCVEVADSVPGVVPVRDSKNVAGLVVIVAAPAWAAFVAHLKG